MHRNQRILIVEDDSDVVEALKVVLESCSYEVLVAASGREGLALARSGEPDLVILDIMMETRDKGFQICHAIRNDPDLSHIAILVLTAVRQSTGFAFSPDTDGNWLPADDYVEKPFIPDDILARVRKLLAQKERRR
jgi:two-component system alkaline phosphatase synthesis response regulator PhoP